MTVKRIEGDRYMLCEYPLMGEPEVLATSASLQKVCQAIPDHLQQERLSVCRVGFWLQSMDYESPRDVETLFEIEPYAPLEEED